MYHIEYAGGGAKNGRMMMLLESVATQQQSETDINLISDDRIVIPTYRSLLALHSSLLRDLLSNIPCCFVNQSISVPFNNHVVKNLLAILSSGQSLGLNKEDILGVQYAADVLKIRLGNLEVQRNKKNVVQVDLDGSSSVQSLFNEVVKKAMSKEKDTPQNSPKPYEQNDDIIDENDNEEEEIVEITPEMYPEEVVEITPEIYHDDPEEYPDDSEGYPAHFLMQQMQMEEEFNSVNNSMDESWGEDPSKKPEMIELDDEDLEGEKKYKCSFCPNKVFKKKPEVLRHFKKHIPLSQRKRAQCDKCRERFISNSNLKTHTKVCTGVVKTYTCKRCKAMYDNKTDYETHMAEEHNSRNHKCPICQKQLRRAGDVKKHMLTHSEGKPYACDLCGKRFRTESYVKVHRQAHLTGSPAKHFHRGDIEAVEYGMKVENDQHNLDTQEITEEMIEQNMGLHSANELLQNGHMEKKHEYVLSEQNNYEHSDENLATDEITEDEELTKYDDESPGFSETHDADIEDEDVLNYKKYDDDGAGFAEAHESEEVLNSDKYDDEGTSFAEAHADMNRDPGSSFERVI